jgi:hypothetical protein
MVIQLGMVERATEESEDLLYNSVGFIGPRGQLEYTEEFTCPWIRSFLKVEMSSQSLRRLLVRLADNLR